MKIKEYSLPACLALITLFAVILLAERIKRNIDFPLKCTTFGQFDLSRKEGEVKLYDLALVLRFENEKNAILLLDGQVTSAEGAEPTLINRTIILNEGKKVDAKSYYYNISKMNISPVDNTATPEFNQLFSEFTGDPSVLQFDILKLDTDTYVIGGPVSWLFTCSSY